MITVLLAAASLSPPQTWQTYVNARFGFEICYPADILKPQGEADNGDGQTFVAADGAELRAFGTNNALGRSLAGEASDQARYYMGRRGRITYHAAKPGWQVISGDDGAAGLFYTRAFRRDGQFVMFQLKYPKAAAARYNPVLVRLSRCFR